MTGNKNAWRAPLAGLASVAMIATMGVAASTANAEGTTQVEGDNKVFLAQSAWGKVNANDPSKWVSTTNPAYTFVAKGSTVAKAAGMFHDVVDGEVVTGWTLTNNAGGEAQKDAFNYALRGTGAEYTLTPSFTKADTSVQFDGVATYDAMQGDTVTVPGSSVWYEYDGSLYPSGSTVYVDKSGSMNFKKIDVTDGYVKFNADGGQFADKSSIAYKKIDGSGKVSLPANPTKDDATFAGWELVSGDWSADKNDLVNGLFVGNIADITFSKNAELKAHWNNLEELTVRFHYGSYANAPKDSYVKVAPNAAVAVPAKPAREGYLFLGWYFDKDNDGDLEDSEVFNASTTLAGNVNNKRDFTLVAKWGKDSELGQQDAKTALQYVVAVDSTVASGADNDAKAFTSASWDAFTTVYKKALNEYNAAAWDQWNGSMKAETAKSIIDQLQAGWKDLRFNNGVTDTTIDGVKKGAQGAEMVYRLATPDGQRHFMTADEKEVLARTTPLTGLNGWKLESASSFRMVNNKWAKDEGFAGDQGSQDTKLGYEVDKPASKTVTLPLVKTVTRLYNSVNQEHLYSTDSNEVKTLTNGSHDWSVDSSEAYLFTPALYSTSKEVARFYNEKTGLHFYTTDKAEINFWTVQHPGIWQKETTGIYAL